MANTDDSNELFMVLVNEEEQYSFGQRTECAKRMARNRHGRNSGGVRCLRQIRVD